MCSPVIYSFQPPLGGFLFKPHPASVKIQPFESEAA